MELQEDITISRAKAETGGTLAEHWRNTGATDHIMMGEKT